MIVVTSESLGHGQLVGGVQAPPAVVTDGGDHVVVGKVRHVVTRLVDTWRSDLSPLPPAHLSPGTPG